MIKFKDYLNPVDQNLTEATEAIDWHIENEVPLKENVYRVGSEQYFALWQTARQMVAEGTLEVFGVDKALLEETEIGEFAEFNGEHVPLDCPMYTEEKDDVELNKPKRGGSKKFYVYVRNPKTKNIKKVEWGAKGMSVGIHDAARRKSFAARHKCTTTKDKTTASYWACRTGRYPHLTGGKKKYTWW